MEIHLYQYEKRINDLDYPTRDSSTIIGYLTKEVQIRGGVSLINPTFYLTSPKGEPEYFWENYIYVPKWKRWYFVNNVTFDGNITFIECSEDVLASWYDKIVSSTFYCTRCASDYDPALTDTLFPAISDVFTYSLSVSNPWTDITGGTYVVAIASGDNEMTHIGTNVYYMMNTAAMTDFMQALMGKADLSISGLVDSLIKTMVDPLQYIRSCYWFPFELKSSVMKSDHIDFSWWSAECDSEAILLEHNSDAYTKFEFTFEYSENMFETDYDSRGYQHYAPYSHYILTAYPFGSFELPNAIITQWEQGNDLNVSVFIDHVTGMAELIIKMANIESVPFVVTTAQVGVEIPVGEVLQNFAGAILSIGAAVPAALTGNVVGAASGITNAVSSVVPTPTVQGTAGGFAQLMLDEDWNITRYYQPNFPRGDFKGEPCCDNKKVGDLSGFALFDSVEIEGVMLRQEKELIAGLLESGIFIPDN